MELKRINFESEIIELVGRSGKIYKPKELSAGRMGAWEQAWLKAQFNMNPTELFKGLFTIIEALKKNDVFTASTVAYKLAEGTGRISDGKTHYFLELFACFFVTDDEDISTLNESMIKEKVADLCDYSADDLFILAGGLMPAFINAYNENKENISENQNSLKSKE